MEVGNTSQEEEVENRKGRNPRRGSAKWTAK